MSAENAMRAQAAVKLNELRDQVAAGRLDVDAYLRPASQGGGKVEAPAAPRFAAIAETEGALALGGLVEQPQL
jgi:hypothetical protein